MPETKLSIELRRLRAEKSRQLGRKVTRNEAAAAIGIGAATLGMLESGNRSIPDSANLLRLCAYYGVPAESFVDALAPDLKSAAKTAGGPETQVVPFGGFVACGEPIDPDMDAHGPMRVPGHYPGDVIAFRARGDSMVGAGILDGDWLIVRKKDTADVGETVIVEVDGRITLKVLEMHARRERGKKEKALMPRHDNAKPIFLDADQRPTVVGELLAVYRKLTPPNGRAKAKK